MAEPSSNDSLYYKTEEDGRALLSFPTGIAGNKHYLRIFADQKDKPGYIIRGKSLEEWKFEGLKKRQGTYHLVGPYLEGQTLESFLQNPIEDVLPRIAQLLDAWALIEEQQRPLFELETDLIFFLKDGGILLLPVEIFKNIQGANATGKRLSTYAAFNHPFLEDQVGCSFSLAALLYKVFSGGFPFLNDSHDKIKDRMELGTIPAPHFLRPELKTEVSEALAKVLRNKKDASLSFAEWKVKLLEWQENGVEEELSESTRSISKAEAEKKVASIHKVHQRKLFVKKNKGILIGAAGVAFVVLVIIYHTLSVWLKPRVTKGFTAPQVVNAFYHSINRMDFITMEDAAINDAGDPEIGEASHMQVMSKMNQAYQMNDDIVHAGAWEKKGMPEVREGQVIYGITNLIITELGSPEKPVFQVTFDKWTPGPDKSKPHSNPPQILNNRTPTIHVVHLSKDGEDWVIHQIDRQSR